MYSNSEVFFFSFLERNMYMVFMNPLFGNTLEFRALTYLSPENEYDQRTERITG